VVRFAVEPARPGRVVRVDRLDPVAAPVPFERDARLSACRLVVPEEVIAARSLSKSL